MLLDKNISRKTNLKDCFIQLQAFFQILTVCMLILLNSLYTLLFVWPSRIQCVFTIYYLLRQTIILTYGNNTKEKILVHEQSDPS